MKRSRQSLFLLTPLVLVAAGSARAQDAGAAPAATTALAASTAAPPPSSPPPTAPASTAPAAAPAPSSADGGQKESGFAFETHVYGQLFGIGGIGGGALPLLVTGIFAGYKLDRLIIGLGFDLMSHDAGPGNRTLIMRWIPGLRYELVRSSDNRVALFGQVDVGIGHDFGVPVANEIIDADVGLGVRYWLHPQFAVAGVGGWNGRWALTQTPDTSDVTQGMFAGIQLLGVF